MATPAKKPKYEKAKNYYAKQARKKQSLQETDQGFLVTCNFREKDCLREVYRLLNEYSKTEHKTKPVESDADDDITNLLAHEIEQAKQDVKDKAHMFHQIETGTTNCMFIKTTVDDPLELGVRIIRDLAESKEKKSKFILRMIPIETVCRAKLEDIINAAGKLFDKHFLKDPSTFAINFNKRLNNDVSRADVIKELADLVTQKNIGNKVNLGNPDKSIVVEIIKGWCCLSVVPDYLKLKKYNVNELWTTSNDSKPDVPETISKEKEVDSVGENGNKE